MTKTIPPQLIDAIGFGKLSIHYGAISVRFAPRSLRNFGFKMPIISFAWVGHTDCNPGWQSLN